MSGKSVCPETSQRPRKTLLFLPRQPFIFQSIPELEPAQLYMILMSHSLRAGIIFKVSQDSNTAFLMARKYLMSTINIGNPSVYTTSLIQQIYWRYNINWKCISLVFQDISNNKKMSNASTKEPQCNHRCQSGAKYWFQYPPSIQTPVLSINIVFHSVKWNRLGNITGELLFFPYCINLLMLLQISWTFLTNKVGLGEISLWNWNPHTNIVMFRT